MNQTRNLRIRRLRNERQELLWPCDLGCSRHFSTKSGLIRHQRIVHSTILPVPDEMHFVLPDHSSEANGSEDEHFYQPSDPHVSPL